jgi:hypothetical protein
LAAEKLANAEGKSMPAPVVDAGSPVVAAVLVDAGAPAAVEVPDAGQPTAIAAAPVDAGVPVAVKPPEESGPPWVLMGAAGGLAAVAFLFLVVRRRSRPPTLDD